MEPLNEERLDEQMPAWEAPLQPIFFSAPIDENNIESTMDELNEAAFGKDLLNGTGWANNHHLQQTILEIQGLNFLIKIFLFFRYQFFTKIEN